MFKTTRYIGSKNSLLNFLEENIFFNFNKETRFLDAFSGTSIVSQYVKETKKCFVDSADFSIYSNSMANILNLDNNKVDYSYIEEKISNISRKADIILENIDKYSLSKEFIITSLFSNAGIYQRNFFSPLNSIIIDLLRKSVFEEKNINQKIVLEQILLKYTNDSANTTGVFGAFLKTPAKSFYVDLNIIEQLKKQSFEFNKKSIFFQKSILETLEEIDFYDVIYLDPPYNSRKYESNYHILNYIVDPDFNIDFIKNETKTAMPKNMVKNDFGSKNKTKFVFEKMIEKAIKKCNILAISYNTDGIVKQEDMELWAEKYSLKLETIKKPYGRYSSRNNESDIKNETDLYEIIWKMTEII